MTIEEKDKYIADHLMGLSDETMRFMIADLHAANCNMERICDKRQKTIDAQLKRHQEFQKLYDDLLVDRDAWQHTAEIKADYADKLKKELERR